MEWLDCRRGAQTNWAHGVKFVGLNVNENDLVCAGKVEGWDDPPDYE